MMSSRLEMEWHQMRRLVISG